MTGLSAEMMERQENVVCVLLFAIGMVMDYQVVSPAVRLS